MLFIRHTLSPWKIDKNKMTNVAHVAQVHAEGSTGRPFVECASQVSTISERGVGKMEGLCSSLKM